MSESHCAPSVERSGFSHLLSHSHCFIFYRHLGGGVKGQAQAPLPAAGHFPRFRRVKGGAWVEDRELRAGWAGGGQR